jgi:hypothetical protein
MHILQAQPGAGPAYAGPVTDKIVRFMQLLGGLTARIALV